MTLLEFATNIKNKISARLTEINAALVNKGQTACADISEVPAKIEAITTKTDMSDANATGAQLLSGYRAYNNGGWFDGEIEKAGDVKITVTVNSDGVVTASGNHSSSGYVESTDKISGTANLTVEEWTITYTAGSSMTKKVVVI